MVCVSWLSSSLAGAFTQRNRTRELWGSAQELAFISGTFHDAEGQAVANAESIIDYRPIDVVPSGGKMPFKLTILGVQSITNYNCSVEAEPSSQTMRQDFEILELNQWADDSGEYCVAANVRNQGDALQENLVIIAILYDGQDNVISFSLEGGPPPSMVGGDTLVFLKSAIRPSTKRWLVTSSERGGDKISDCMY